MLRLAATAAARAAPRARFAARPLGSLAAGVDFDTVAREWRCKWSADNDKASLVAAQKELEAVLSAVKAVKGVSRVQRIVCGGCLDFKVITSVDAAEFGAWAEGDFAPEADFLAALGAIDGVDSVETQTFTCVDV